MRLWHIDLIEYLPRSQLIAQWRELNSIYVKQDKHILINFIYDYPKTDLLIYSQIVLQEMMKRGYKFNLKNYDEYFNFNIFDDDYSKIGLNNSYCKVNVFEKHMDDIYFDICCYNLYEKALRGQKDVEKKTFDFLENIILNKKRR